MEKRESLFRVCNGRICGEEEEEDFENSLISFVSDSPDYGDEISSGHVQLLYKEGDACI